MLICCWWQTASLAIFIISKVSAISYLVSYIEVHYCRSWDNFPLSLCSSFRGFQPEPSQVIVSLILSAAQWILLLSMHPSSSSSIFYPCMQASLPVQVHLLSLTSVPSNSLSAGLRIPPRAHPVVHAGFLPLMRTYLFSAPEIILNAFQITS